MRQSARWVFRWAAPILSAWCGCVEAQHPTAEPVPKEAPRLALSIGPAGTTPSFPATPDGLFQVQGHRIHVQAIPDVDTFMVSEPIFVRFVVRNASTHPFSVENAWMGRNQLGRPENYSITATDKSGSQLPTPDAGPQFGGMSSTIELQPGESHEVRLFLRGWVQFNEPGTHTLRVSTTMRIRRTDAEAWTELPVFATAKVELRADDPNELGIWIEETAKLALANDDEACSKLMVVRDTRVVPHLVKMLQTPEYSLRYEATRALGTWNDERALAALSHAKTTSFRDLDPTRYANDQLRQQSADLLRVAVAQALAESPHPKAIDELLTMKADPYSSVRLTVLHAAARLPKPQAQRHVQSFTGDSDAMVRDEAARYLRELANP